MYQKNSWNSTLWPLITSTFEQSSWEKTSQPFFITRHKEDQFSTKRAFSSRRTRQIFPPDEPLFRFLEPEKRKQRDHKGTQKKLKLLKQTYLKSMLILVHVDRGSRKWPVLKCSFWKVSWKIVTGFQITCYLTELCTKIFREISFEGPE